MRPSAFNGIDLSAPFPTSVDDVTVLVPDISIPNSELFLQQLQRYNIDPLQDDSNESTEVQNPRRNSYMQTMDVCITPCTVDISVDSPALFVG